MVMLHRDGLDGLLQLDSNTPAAGRSQVSVRLPLCPPSWHPPYASRELGQPRQDPSSGWAVFHGDPMQLSSRVLLLGLATLGGLWGHTSIPEGELSLQTSPRWVHGDMKSGARRKSHMGARLQAGFYDKGVAILWLWKVVPRGSLGSACRNKPLFCPFGGPRL